MNFKSKIQQRSLNYIFATVLLFSGLVAPLVAADKYLAPGQLDTIALLPSPPQPGTPEHAADLASARAVFKARTPEEEARAVKDATLTVFNFRPAIGEFFRSNNLPKTEVFFHNLKYEIKTAINTPKDFWKRSRPYQIDSTLEFGKPEPSFSYPSGHSTQGMVQALVLADLFPSKRDGILEIGRNIGWDRVLIGKHFPTDVFAGRVVAQAVVRELKKSPAFQSDLAAVKAEIDSFVATQTRESSIKQ